MIWASPPPDGAVLDKNTTTFTIVLYFTDFFRVISVKVKFLHIIQQLPYLTVIQHSICTNLLFTMSFRQAAMWVFPNFSPFSLQQDIMQYFQIHYSPQLLVRATCKYVLPAHQNQGCFQHTDSARAPQMLQPTMYLLPPVCWKATLFASYSFARAGLLHTIQISAYAHLPAT